jgi:hypothetical protein
VPVIPPPELAQLAAGRPLFKLAAVTVKGAPFEQKTVASVTLADIGPAREGSIVNDKLPAVPALQTAFSVPVTGTVGEIDPAAIATPAISMAITSIVTVDTKSFFFMIHHPHFVCATRNFFRPARCVKSTGAKLLFFVIANFFVNQIVTNTILIVKSKIFCFE